MRQFHLAAAAIFVSDQASKYLVVHVLDLYTRLHYPIIPPFLQFRMAWNEGINFGLLSSSHTAAQALLIVLALAISAWIWRWAHRERHSRAVQLSAGVLVGGALGNVVDRIIYGAVADFLNMGLPGWDNPFSFNIADIAIFVGAVGLVFFAGREKTP
jgi:signal peptidase II